MNQLLAHYCIDMKHPEVSGAEHLEMLKIRDRLVDIEPALIPEEQTSLAEADQVPVEQAVVFCEELSRFVDLAKQRQTDNIPSSRWWWYLDVIRHLPDQRGMAPAR